MKRLIYVALVAIAVVLFFSACKKQAVDPTTPFTPSPVPAAYFSVVGKYIRQHPLLVEYNQVDFTNYSISKQKANWYLRLGLQHKSPFKDFVVLQTDSLGNISDDRLVHIEPTATGTAKTVKTNAFNGVIKINGADGQQRIQSKITNGFIEAFHENGERTTNTAGGLSLVDPYVDLPEVIVVAYLPVVNEGSSGISVGNYLNLQSLFGAGGGATGAANANAAGYGGNTATYSYNGPYPNNDYPNAGGIDPSTQNQLPADVPDIALAPDESFSRPAIDLNAWLKCFTDIPDAGATSAITLYGDLPVDGNPSVGLNIWNGNTGHCFLQLSKKNGSQSVTQVIGFTAQSAGQAIVNADAFVPSKIVDNAGHKYNCSITMPLTAAGLQQVMSAMQQQANMPYSIVNYDCLDFGLNVFNSVRANPLVINKQYSTSDPFSNIATGPKLYNLLSAMQQNGSPEAPNILISGSKWIGQSHGPCY